MNNQASGLHFDSATMLEGIRSWVEIESPTNDAAAVNAMVSKVADDASQAGLPTRRIAPNETAASKSLLSAGQGPFGDHLLVSSPWGKEDEPGILVVSHLDTVHPIGTLAGSLPFRVEGDRAYGPGIYDMKASAFIALAALKYLASRDKPTSLPIRHLFVADEEVGSYSSRLIIEQEARRARYGLVTEPAREGGKIVTARKGNAIFRITVRGKSAHAGARHADGRSAVRELARQVIELEELTDYEAGITVNVGVFQGGSRSNVVPDEAFAEIDLRAPTQALTEQLMRRILDCRSNDPDITIDVRGDLVRPAFEKSPAVVELFEHARRLAAEIGIELLDLKTGGVSDGNNLAALGVPTLDGMGVDGKDAHSLTEHIFCSSIAPRATLLLRMMETLS